MSKQARKWNRDKEEYEPYLLPDGATISETDMHKIVTCANCGEKTKFGKGYTSLIIHNNQGLGYCICKECNDKELPLLAY